MGFGVLGGLAMVGGFWVSWLDVGLAQYTSLVYFWVFAVACVWVLVWLF